MSANRLPIEECLERRAIVVSGVVQGVGFRPFVHALASRLGLAGLVRNRSGDVWIEVEGPASSLERFLDELASNPPALASIDSLSCTPQRLHGDDQFRIEASEVGAGPVFISPDVATCQNCLDEMLNPADRRYCYPFLNCTDCGPRLTIVLSAPYDRARTTMAGFPMCTACQAEYDNPADRRFHAQPTACPACGPRLQLHDAGGQPLASNDPLQQFAAALRSGRIGALKGLGGYHLACDARNESAVQELRRRKHRDEKPFAIMVQDLPAARAICDILPAEEDLLLSVRRPIVLLKQRPDAQVAVSVAPGNPFLGVMLPYTPLHYLLMEALVGAPLVMTSGNRSDEPIAYEDAEALRRLAGIADLFLLHNRPIQVRCEDSVTRVVQGLELPMRRSRGYAPQPIGLPLECPEPILAVGGQFKGAFALGRRRHAFLSHHLGDLDDYSAYRAFEKDIGLYQQLFDVQPALIAHDLHPDYASTRYARERETREGVPVCAVQHHHAHMASCMAEHGLTEPVIGVTFDGTGLGLDGDIWGGEFLVGDYGQFQRAAHLRYVGMPGGEQAIREPWRMALAHLLDAGASLEVLEQRLPAKSLQTVARMLEQGLNTLRTSSVGRLFDAVASLAGSRDQASYEGQAAVELEWLASGMKPEGLYPFEITQTEGAVPESSLVVDTRPLIREAARDAVQGVAAAKISRRFHTTIVEIIAAVCTQVRSSTRIDAVVLSGGVFLNALLSAEVSTRLAGLGFRVYRHRLVPPNDGGLSLGQLAVAARRMSYP